MEDVFNVSFLVLAFKDPSSFSVHFKVFVRYPLFTLVWVSTLGISPESLPDVIIKLVERLGAHG